MKRFLNIGYGIEVIDARLNGSHPDMENKNGFKNTTFTKKIGGRGKATAVCVKRNMREFLSEELGEAETIRFKTGKEVSLSKKNKEEGIQSRDERQSISIHDPFNNLQDDVFGNMNLKQSLIPERVFELLSENHKKTFKKTKEGYQGDIVVKRTSNIQMDSLINVSNRRVEGDFGIVNTIDGNGIYNLETYSGIMAGIVNLNIGKIGKFNISDNALEFRDYTVKNAELIGVRDLTIEEKLDRIEKVLKSLRKMQIRGNQTNYASKTKPKFVIMCDYSYGNNIFQGLLDKNGLNIKALKEEIQEYEEYRLSDIYIGVNEFFDKNNNLDLEIIKEELKEYDFIKVDNVHNTFKTYMENLRKDLTVDVK